MKTTPKKLSQEAIGQYLRADEPSCPYCRSKDLSYGSIEIEGNGAYQEVTCNACERRWADSYQLVGLVEID